MNRNEFYTALSDYNDEHSLKHYGTKGQKWGVRKYQNKDGSLTPAGREHYGYGKGKSESKDYSNNEKGLGILPGARFAGNAIRRKALDKKIENGKKLGRFEQKYAAEKLTIALKNDDKEMVDKLKNVLTSEEYDKAEERSQKLWNKRSIVKKAQKDRDKKKAEYEENLKKDPEHTHKHKQMDMNTAESMSDEDMNKLGEIESKMTEVAKTHGTSSAEYKKLNDEYDSYEASVVKKMNADARKNYGLDYDPYKTASKSGIKSFAKKAAHTVSKGVGKVGEKAGEKVFGNDTNGVTKVSKKMDDWGSGKNPKRRAAFDESTRVTGKEEAEAWKRLADYYEAQQKKKKG